MIKTTLELFLQPGAIIEVRALKCWDRNQEFTSNRTGYFDDISKAVQEIEKLERSWHPQGIYVTLNPVKLDLLARAANRIKRAEKDQSTSNEDIVARKWMLIDFDPVRPAGVSSNNDELANADEQAEICEEWLSQNGFPSPVVAMSGNGYHLLYRINEPAEDAGLIKDCLAALSAKFSTPEVTCDAKNFNAARITKLYGTLAQKGDPTTDRPHRRSEILEVRTPLEVVTREKLEWLAGLSFAPKIAQHTANSSDDSKLKVDHYLTRHGLEILKHDQTPDGSERWFIECPGKSLHTSHNANSDCCVTQSPGGELGGHCFHSSCGMTDWQALKNAIGPVEFEDYHDSQAEQDLLNRVDFGWLFAPKGIPQEPNPDAIPQITQLTPDQFDSLDDDELEESIGVYDMDFPSECLRPPGILGEIIDYNLQTAKYPQPEHALAGALAFMSLITGRRVQDESGTRTNLLIVALGPTRSGKEHPRQVNKKILEYCGADAMYEEKLASHASLHGFLQKSPAGLLMNDEFGDFLALARSTKGANTQPAQIISAIIKLYSSAGGMYKADRYADNAKQITIDQPHLVLYGTSTGEVFWKHVTPEYLSGGLFGRVIILENRGYVDPSPLASRKVGLPESIMNEVKGWLGCFDHYNKIFWEHPEPIIVPHTPDALVRYEQHELAISKKRKRETPIRAALWSGTAEITAKLALIFACSRSRNPLQIQVEDVDLAIRLSNWLTRRKVDLSQDNVSENATESAAKRVYRMVKETGKTGITKSVLCRRTQWLKQKERDEILRDLVQSRLVIAEELRSSTKSKVIYRSRNGAFQHSQNDHQQKIEFVT